MTVLKKTAGWILGLGLLAGMMILFPALTKAEISGDFEYSVYEKEMPKITEVEIIGYKGSATDIEIPDQIDGNKVTYIGSWAFEDCSKLTSITIPSSVTYIQDSAFKGCSSLRSITIPTSVTYIGTPAFEGCSELTSITVLDGNPVYDSRDNCNAIVKTETNTIITGCKNTVIPTSVTSIGENAFKGCSGLTSIAIPSGVTRIEKDAFSGCSGLTSITIPSGITRIGSSAFNDCSGLTNIVVSDGNPVYDSRNDCNAIVETETNTLVAGCKNTVVPSDVTCIGEYAFYGCSGLTSITIPSGVKIIEGHAFEGCSRLKSVTIPSDVRGFGISVFNDCSGLTNIEVSDGNPYYDSRNDCNAIIVTATNTLLAGCKNTEIPPDVTSIGNNAFNGCKGLTEITIPDGVTNIGESAFFGCSGLTDITIPPLVTDIGDRTFCGCSGLIGDITIPSGVTSIGDAAFGYCSGLTSITIPDGVKNIGYGAFGYCSGLTSITIPSSVKIIDDSPVMGCSSLTNITVSAGNPYYDSRNSCNAIIRTRTNTLIAGCKNTVIPLSVTNIQFSAFGSCSGLTSITIPPCVSEIKNAAFQDCPNLKDVYYFGTEQEKNEIEIGDFNNDDLVSANWHLNICPIASLGKWFYSWIWFVGGPRL